MDTFSRSVVGGIIALSLVSITLPAPTAQAATLAELQAQIQTLLVQITALQNQLQAMQGLTTHCTVPASDLAFGNRGTDVVALQSFLMDRGYSIPAGATGYFGSQTQNALRQFQAAQGITPALGYNFGTQTRARMQLLCAPAPTPTPQPQPEPEPEPALSGEASLERLTVNDGNDTDLEEGDKNAEIMEVSFEVRDGDVKIDRIYLGFRPDEANQEDDPWDVFSDVSVWKGSKKIADVDASRRDNWREDSPNDGDYLLRMTGLDYIVREDRDLELIVKATIHNSVRGTSDGEIWNVFIPDEGIRGLDADNAAVYTGDTADSVTLNLDEAGATDELIVRRSDDDPDARTLQVNDNSHSGYMQVFAFDLDTDDSRNDIHIYHLPIELTVGTSTLNTFMRDIRLIVDGETYTHESTVDGNPGVVTFDFDRGDLTINAGDRVTASVEIDFKSLPDRYEGTTIVGHVDASDIDAEGIDDLTGNQLESAATGEVHTLYTKGSAVENDRTTAVVTSVDGANNDYVTFGITVDLTAFGQDVYIPIGTTGVTYQLQNSVGTPLGASGTAIVTSSARERNGYFHIPEGSTESVTLDVTYVPGVPNTTARLQLLSINFNDTTSPPDQTWMALPASTYRTATKVIVN